MRLQCLSLNTSFLSAKEWKHWIQIFENYLASFFKKAKNEASVKTSHAF